MSWPFIAWGNAGILWGCACALLCHIIQFWHHPPSKHLRFAQFLYASLFALQGCYLLVLFQANSALTIAIRWGLFGFSVFLLLFFLGGNIFPYYIKIQRHPTFRSGVSYESFLNHLKHQRDQGDQQKDRIKDFSRKLLHLLQFIYYIVWIVVLPLIPSSWYAQNQISVIEFRNVFYYVIALAFWIMMMIGDLLRPIAWRYLPNWGHHWYSMSLDYPKEAWDLNGAIPILLGNFVWIHPSIPIGVFLCAAFCSCVADGVASVVGKLWGLHRIHRFGVHPEKTWEGLIAGGLSAFIGCFILLGISLAPLSSSAYTWVEIGVIAILCMVSEMGIDLYGQTVNDNLLNALIVGSVTWLFLFIFA